MTSRRAPSTRLASGCASFALLSAVLSSGCTWYTNCGETGCPDDPRPRPAPAASGGSGGSEPSAGGTSSAGTSSTAGTMGGPDTGASGAVSGTPPEGEWTPVASNLTELETGCGGIQLVSSKPNEDMLIAGLLGYGLWSSTDGGQSWEELGTGKDSEPISNRATHLLYDPDNPEVFWEAGIYGTVGGYRTEDNGKTFTRLGDLYHVDTISVDFTDPERKTLLSEIHETPRFVRSQDGGETWEDFQDSLPEGAATHCRTPLIVSTDTFLMGCSARNDVFPGILRTTDGGASWSLASDVPVGGAELGTSDGTRYWVGESGNLMRSEDSGETWTEVAPARTLVTWLDPIELPNGMIASVSRPYVVVSSDRGASWQRASAALPYDPAGLAYSPFQNAFFIFRFDCAQMNFTLPDSIARFDWTAGG